MAFPLAPANGDLHTEGGTNYEYDATAGAWLIDDQSGAAGTDLTITPSPTGVQVASSTGNNDDIPLGTPTNAGVMSPADKTKLDTVETNAAADQSAAEVPFTPSGNTAATDLQAAVVELQGDIDAINAASAENLIVGSGAPVAGQGEDGDYYEDALTGDRYGPKAGGVWPASSGNVYAQMGLADATAVAVAGGAGGTATTAARSDHQHNELVGATLPTNDGTAGRRFISDGSGALPAGDYVLPVVGQPWVQA